MKEIKYDSFTHPWTICAQKMWKGIQPTLYVRIWTDVASVISESCILPNHYMGRN